MTTNTSMSVYNKHTNEEKNVIFKKHLIDNVFWDDSKGINRNLGYENTDDVNVFIPKSQNDMTGYVEPKKYKGLNSTWTLDNGDFIVKGNTIESEVLSIKELVQKYDNVFTISLVDDKDFGSESMHHFEIRGK
jgi:hypothetical protein